MHPALRPRSLSAITWRHDPHPVTERVFAESEPQMNEAMRIVIQIKAPKSMAREIIQGFATDRANPRAAAIVARWRRRQVSARRVAA